MRTLPKSEAATNTLVPLHDELQLDPQALLQGYRRFTDQARRRSEGARSPISDTQFRGALQRLREQVRRPAPLLRGTSMPMLSVPSLLGHSSGSTALRAELWRRQTIFNNAVLDVVNHWPSHAQSPRSLCWLRDEVRPQIGAFPVPGQSHRKGLLMRAALRGVKAVTTTAVALAHREPLDWLTRINGTIYAGLEALVDPARPSDAALEALAERLLAAHREVAPRSRLGLGFDDQVDFVHQAALALASLVLPGEGALEAVYPAWRTAAEARREAAQAKSDAVKPDGHLSVVLVGERAERRSAPLVSSLQCQPGNWSCATLVSSETSRRTDAAVSLNVLQRSLEGDWVALVTESVTFSPWMVDAFLREVERQPDARLMYSDHDEQGADGVLRRPFFKPGWSPDLFNEVNYLGGVLFVRRDTFDAWTARMTTITPEAVSRLVLSVHARGEAIVRIPEVLWHRLDEAGTDAQSHALAVGAHLREAGVAATLEPSATGHRVRYQVKGRPLVSLIVPFKDKPELLEQLVTSMQQHERYEQYELLLVSNNSKNRATARMVAKLQGPRVVVREWNQPFNYQAINNAAVREWARGEFLAFVNNDISFEAGGALEEMLGLCQQPGVGAVGANLRFPNGRLQHAGVALGLAGMAAHPFAGVRPNAKWTAYGLPSWTRNYLAVTAAFLMTRRSTFDAVGGFDEDFVVSGGDVDLCLRIGQQGYRIVNTPHVGVVHHESATRAGHVIPDIDAWKSWASFAKHVTAGDPFYNPNLSLTSQDCLPKLDERSGEELGLQLLSMLLPSSQQLIGSQAS